MERKKISLEIQWAVGPKTGVGWYIFNIVKGLVQNNKNDYTGEFINFMNRHNVKEQINYDIKIKQNKFISYKIYSILTQKLKISHNFLMNTKSDLIITISESAKADIIKHFNIDEKKIKIVTPGIDLQKYSYKYSKSELENIRKKYTKKLYFIFGNN